MQSKRIAWDSLQAVALIGTYQPRRCGIATFTSDLAEAIAGAAPEINTWAVAMNDRPEGYRYPPRVWFEINQNRLGEYRLAADFLNMSNVDVCCIQHEFGIYGGTAGRHLLELIRRLRMPTVATLHTVLRDPEPHYRESMLALVDAVDGLVVMAERARDFLRDIYKVPDEKIELIHHGIPEVPFVDPNFYKDQFGVEGRKVILTFGLLGPSKGIENMLDAMPRIVAKHPDVTYIVLGATHPGVMAESGEDYRLGLSKKCKALGIEKNVEFVNKFVELDELVEYLGAADVYVTPYHNEAQITSGTLAYALGTGKATVSTPYWYAQEMLADGRGKIVPFKQADALADAIIHLFDEETDRHATRKRAYQFTRQMRWRDVANDYLRLFAHVREDRNRNPRPAVTSDKRKRVAPELTEIKLDHLRSLTDDTGIFQHAKKTIPDRAFGYATQDAARALTVLLLAQDHLSYNAGTNLDKYISRFLSFIEHAFDDETQRFRNQMSFERTWVDADGLGSEDAHGRSVWGLGEAVARCQIRGHAGLAHSLFHRALPACEELRTPHGIAYSLIGIHAYLRRFSGDSHARRVRENLARRLFEMFQSGADDWPWPTNVLSYASARLPQSLLLSGRWMFNDQMIQQALRSLEWLHQVQVDDDGRFLPVGTEGFYARGGTKARFSQRPIEACSSIDAYLEAFRVTADEKWVDRAYRCLNWFLGENDLRLPLYDPSTGGCADSLDAHAVNENQGAEATLSWLQSLLAMYEHVLDQESGMASISEAPKAGGDAGKSNDEKDAAGESRPQIVATVGPAGVKPPKRASRQPVK